MAQFHCAAILTALALWTAAPATAQRAAAAGSYMNLSFVGLTDFGWSTEPDVGSLQLGDHDPRVRGFTIPNAELALDGAVDPYFKGFSNIVYKLDSEGETGVELEEVYFLTTSLPGNLQLKGRAVFRRVRPPESAAPARVGVRGPAAGAQSHVRPRGTAQPGNAGSPGWCRRRGTPRPWSGSSTAPGERRSASAPTNHRRSTAACRSSADVRSTRATC